uniref:Uncharacterized protein n=1 Tax=Arundo donax TaxID=35708 RepID=A0A0A9A1G0_ARUDO
MPLPGGGLGGVREPDGAGHGDRRPHQAAHRVTPKEDPGRRLVQAHRHEGRVRPLPQPHHHRHPRFRA